jgi:DNA-3-methyladenine glycosylase II
MSNEMDDKILTISETNFPAAIDSLCKKDSDLKQIVARLGNPPFFSRAAGFPSLIYIILEQQVSMASAKATFERLQQNLIEVTPENFLKLDDFELRSIGFSRQKMLYCRELATAIVERRLGLDALETLPDGAVQIELTKIKGIGRWTTDVYLLMCLCRADAFPVGDLGVIVAAQRAKNLENRPTQVELEIIAENWRPFRAVAVRILWHYYLTEIRPMAGY